MKLALIDYGVGNLHSAAKALKLAAETSDISLDVAIGNNLRDLEEAEAIVLPGDGAFRECRLALSQQEGMESLLTKRVLNDRVPFLGICVGMQLLASKSYEGGETKGLGWIDGTICRIETGDHALKVPHMGWNDVVFQTSHPLFADLRHIETPQAYFLHSYHFLCNHQAHSLATTDHGGQVTAMVGRDNIIGTQFHPEKSQTFGIALLSSFLRWARGGAVS